MKSHHERLPASECSNVKEHVYLHHISPPQSNTLAEAIWEMDLLSGQITYERGFDILFGEKPFTDKPFTWWFPRIGVDDRDAVIKQISDVFARRDETWRALYWFKHGNGSYRYVQDSGHIIYDGMQAVRLIGTFQDLTLIKELENTIANERLESHRKVAETVIRITEKERSRLGLELHDNVNQLLACANLFLNTVHPTAEADVCAQKKTQAYITLAIEEIRKLSKALVMPSLSGPDLVSSIVSLTADIEAASTLKIDFQYCFGETKLSSGKRLAIYRIIQEQLKNILKHSHATEAVINLESNNDDVTLVMTDNGVGMDCGHACSGIGLKNIQERVNFYCGSVSVVSAKGDGFRLEVKIPRKKAVGNRACEDSK